MLKIEQDGVEYEFIRYDDAVPPKHAYFYHPQMEMAVNYSGERCVVNRSVAIFRPKPRRYQAGGVEWEETGEVRRLRYDDVFLNSAGEVEHWIIKTTQSDNERSILRPVRILEEGESNERT